MDFENVMESEVIVAVGATVAVLSPRVRNLLRRGAVYGVAGLLMAGDVLTGAARNVARGAQDGASNAVITVQEASDRIRAAATNGREAAEPEPVIATPAPETPRPATRARGRAAAEASGND